MPTFTLLRHGQTGKAERDFDRRLTEEGVRQALARRESLGHPTFDLVIASPAKRAADTAAIAADDSIIVILSELYASSDPADRATIEHLFDKLGYAPLREYHRAGGEDAFNRYAAAACEAIRKTTALCSYDKDPHILVVGHAVLINSIAATLFGQDSDLILDANLGEVEGFRVMLNDKKADVELLV